MDPRREIGQHVQRGSLPMLADRGARMLKGGSVSVEPIAEIRFEALLAHCPGQFIDLAGSGGHVDCRSNLMGLGHLRRSAFRLGCCRLVSGRKFRHGASDGSGHFGKFGAQALRIDLIATLIRR
jgi:hypothetical protein